MSNEKLSKYISFLLRHSDDENLEFDTQGWTNINDLLFVLNNEGGFNSIKESDIQEIIDNSSKKRFEISGDKIRALYGHSRKDKIVRQATQPPKILLHGTPIKNIENIMKEGLLSLERQYVHLTTSEEMAKSVAKRYSKDIVVLEIEALRACKNGVNFYKINEEVWLADKIDSQYIIIN